jgi:hypothetical protein
MTMKRIMSLAAAAVLASNSLLAAAENATHVPGYTIHHNALTTDTLTPQVAKTYDIQRSKNRGLLNVSVIKEQEGTTGTPVKARIDASASNLTGQSRTIELREVIDGDAIYYLADFRVANQETLEFRLEVQPEGADTSYSAGFSQQFFTD